jgi:serine/threonine protein phosphatase 1
MKRKIYVIGDIHGELDKLINLINQLPKDKHTKFIFMGDYVDRGCCSYEVIEYLIHLNAEYQCVFLKGNHDVEFWYGVEENLQHQEFPLYNQGAKETILSYVMNGESLNCHKTFFENLKDYHIEDNMLFVHGGYNRHFLISEQLKSSFTFWWDRDLWNAALGWESSTKEHPFKNKDNFKEIYIGHSPTLMWDVSVPMKAANIWNLDTGCGKWKFAKLSAVEINSKKIYQSEKIIKVGQIYSVIGQFSEIKPNIKNILFKVTKYEGKDICFGTYINAFTLENETENCLLNIDKLNEN